MWVKQCHVYHPPGKSPFLQVVFELTIPRWLIYGIILHGKKKGSRQSTMKNKQYRTARRNAQPQPITPEMPKCKRQKRMAG